jgi:hypothetical protein
VHGCEQLVPFRRECSNGTIAFLEASHDLGVLCRTMHQPERCGVEADSAGAGHRRGDPGCSAAGGGDVGGANAAVSSRVAGPTRCLQAHNQRSKTGLGSPRGSCGSFVGLGAGRFFGTVTVSAAGFTRINQNQCWGGPYLDAEQPHMEHMKKSLRVTFKMLRIAEGESSRRS